MEFSGWELSAVAAKTLVYAATLGAAGTVFFLSYSEDLLQPAQRARIVRWLGLQLFVAAFATLLRILLLTGSMSGEISGMLDRDMAQMILEAGEGASAALRIAGLALAACALARNRKLKSLAALGAALAATSFAAVGHTRALHPHVPATVLSCLHLLAGAFWIGALVPLLKTTQGLPREVGALAQRFARSAIFVVPALIVAGLGLLWMLSYGHADFWSSGYALMIALKLLLVALLLCAAGFNKLRLTPKLIAGSAAAVSGLRRSIQLEILLGVLILTVTACFTSLTGPPH